MAQPTVLHGDWEELVERARELGASKNLTLIIPGEPGEEETAIKVRRPSMRDASPDQKVRELDKLAAINSELPGLPDEAFDRETLHEEWE